MSGLFRFITLFVTGGIIYAVIEILFRGFTHWSMILTGGICLYTIYLADVAMPRKGLLFKCFCGCVIITFFELIVGLLVNRLLGWDVWDYSAIPFNFMGQICLLFSAIWFLLSVPALYICHLFRKYVFAAPAEKKEI